MDEKDGTPDKTTTPNSRQRSTSSQQSSPTPNSPSDPASSPTPAEASTPSSTPGRPWPFSWGWRSPTPAPAPSPAAASELSPTPTRAPSPTPAQATSPTPTSGSPSWLWGWASTSATESNQPRAPAPSLISTPEPSSTPALASSPTPPTDSRSANTDPEQRPTPVQATTVPLVKASTSKQEEPEKPPTTDAKTPDDIKDDKPESEEEFNDDIELDADLLESVLFYLGSFGTYQKFLFMAMIPFSVFYSWIYFAPMFVLATPRPFWCFVPELANLTKEKRRELSAPDVTNDGWNGCMVYDADWQAVISSGEAPPSTTPMKACTTGWDFDFSEIPYPTVTSERGWVCNGATYVPMAQSMFFAGSFVGSLFFGWIADYCGRVPAIMASNLLGGIGGLGTIFTRGLWDFMFCRFLCGMSFDNCLMIAYILVLEYVGPSHRTLVATMPIALYYGAATVVLPWIAYYIANWRSLTYINYLPMFIVMLAPWVIPESVRWLVSRGRVYEAEMTLRKFEKVNRTKIPYNVLKAFLASSEEMSNKNKESLFSLFKRTLLRNTMIYMSITYSFCACVYDVLVRLSESFGFDFFITFTINAAAEIPSVLVAAVFLDKLGRRNLTWAPMGASAIAIIICMCVPKGLIRVSLAVIARFGISLAYTVTVQWATEILPTPFRATGSAVLHMIGFGTSLLSPFIVYSENVTGALPFIIICTMTTIATVCSLMIPETKGLEMPQTIADSEKIIQEYSLFRKPDVVQLKQVLSKVVQEAVKEPIRRRKEGRVNASLSSSTMSRLRSRLSLETFENSNVPNVK